MVLVDSHLFVDIKLSNAKNMHSTGKKFCARYVLLPPTCFTPSDVVLIPHRKQGYDYAKEADHRKERKIEGNVRPVHAERA
jgi:hypothetical protein